MKPVVHFDIPVSDPDQAKGFFGKLFGWNIKEVPGMDYWIAMTAPTDSKGMLKKPGAINGGFSKRSAGDVDRAYFMIEVEDIDVMLKDIEAAGGKIVAPKTSIGQWGYIARFTDPDGNLFGLHQTLPKD